MKPIEDELQFTIDIWFEKTGSGQAGPIPYVTGTSYLKFDSDTNEEITISAFDFILDLSGQYVSKIYSGNIYKMERNPSRVMIPPPNYFKYQGEHTLQQEEWHLPDTTGEHRYYTFYKYQ